MTTIITLLLVAIVVIVGLFYPGWQRKRILSKPFPESWLNIVRRRLSFFEKLSANEQEIFSLFVSLINPCQNKPV